MSLVALTALALGIGATGNPLLGTWIGQRAATVDRIDIAGRSTMTITPDAILFGAGRREIGVAPISGFEHDDGTMSVRTRFGELYRFRFSDADHICRVADLRTRDRMAAATPQCFARGKA